MGGPLGDSDNGLNGQEAHEIMGSCSKLSPTNAKLKRPK